MHDAERHAIITELLGHKPFATVRDLQGHLGVSAATIRRDIDKLHETGKARKVHGGVAANEGAGRLHQSARPYNENRDIDVETKEAIAERAMSLVRDGDSVIIHGGSTCFQFGARLARRNLRIYTNSMPLAAYLGEAGACDLTVAGGQLYREPGIIHDLAVDRPAFFASRFFVGAQGVSSEGALESHPLLTATTQGLSRCADEVVLLADSRKFAIQPPNTALPLSRIGTIVTDDGLTDEDAKMLENAGVTILIAGDGSAPR